MKTFTFVLLSLFSVFSAFAQTPYTKEAFEKSQEKNERILLQVYASWCPVCKNEDKVFANVKNQGLLNNVTYFQANFDTEKLLKNDFKVKNPGTVILFEGKKEIRRVEQMPTEADFKKFIE